MCIRQYNELHHSLDSIHRSLFLHKLQILDNVSCSSSNKWLNTELIVTVMHEVKLIVTVMHEVKLIVTVMHEVKLIVTVMHEVKLIIGQFHFS